MPSGSVNWSAVSPGGYDVPIRITGAGKTVTVMAHVNEFLAGHLGPKDYIEADGYRHGKSSSV